MELQTLTLAVRSYALSMSMMASFSGPEEEHGNEAIKDIRTH